MIMKMGIFYYFFFRKILLCNDVVSGKSFVSFCNDFEQS